MEQKIINLAYMLLSDMYKSCDLARARKVE